MGVRDYLYCPHCAAILDRGVVEGKERSHCGACGFIHYDNPIPSVGMLVLQEGEYLLIKRGIEPGLGTWCPPSGFMEAGESMEETAARELREETGLEGEVKELIGVYFESPHIYGHVIAIVYLMEITGGELRAGDDAGDARYFPRENLPEIPFRCFREAIAKVNEMYP